jgi:hypothetical protein
MRNPAMAAEAAGRAELVPMWARQSASLSACTDVSAFLISSVEEVSEIADPSFSGAQRALENRILSNEKGPKVCNKYASLAQIGACR